MMKGNDCYLGNIEGCKLCDGNYCILNQNTIELERTIIRLEEKEAYYKQILHGIMKGEEYYNNGISFEETYEIIRNELSNCYDLRKKARKGEIKSYNKKGGLQ